MLKISELAARTGLSPHTLRYYEKHGLISASERSEAGYRYYNEADVRRVDFVRTARNIGFSLDDIGQLLSIRVDKQAHSCGEVTEITRHKLEEVSARIKELQSMEKTLRLLLDSCCGGPEQATHCSIMDALEAGELADAKALQHSHEPSNNSHEKTHVKRTVTA
jgi:MerR family Zn(II)-responsive transcriptional regulator of zntA